jgi:acetyl-CoA carboxylase biotin carboxyl carrier protein
MKLTEDEVIQVLKLVEASSFDELHLETGDIKLVVRKKGTPGGPVAECGLVSASPGAVAPAGSVVQAARPLKDEERKGQEREVVKEEGLVPIKSPMLGTVYRRPSPDAPHYVEVGSQVKEDDTICLIEVMKVFTAVKAGVRGQISRILVETNEMVEYGQPLFLVKPETPAA